LAAKMCRLPRKWGCYNTFWFQMITKIWRGEKNFKSGGVENNTHRALAAIFDFPGSTPPRCNLSEKRS
jgi:hypothetical protein